VATEVGFLGLRDPEGKQQLPLESTQRHIPEDLNSQISIFKLLVLDPSAQLRKEITSFLCLSVCLSVFLPAWTILAKF
jgi:hypothetical protein